MCCATYLEGSGLDLERFEAVPGRASLVARIEGTDADAPTLLLMGHTDVVPVNADRWRHDPFGGEVIDGEVWGRGAVDMLNLTASMAVAIKRLATSGFRPEGHARSTWPSPTRRRSAPTAPTTSSTTSATPCVADYVHHRVGRHPDPEPDRA